MKLFEKIKYLIKLCRIKQWIKNGFVFAAIIFSGKIFNLHEVKATIYTFIVFSFISSCVYILNDIVDVQGDMNHPKKKFRPIASGKVTIKEGKLLFVFMFIITITASILLNTFLTVIILIYFILNLIYAFKLKKIIIIDVMTIALGFILRVLAGAVVIRTLVSPWLIVCTGLLSLYLGFGKRKNELIVLEGTAGEHRKILMEYNLPYLEKILLMILSLTNMTYILYSINGTVYKGMIYTIPFVLYGTLRYEYLISNKNLGGSPEDAFTEDISFLFNIFFWIITAGVAIYYIK